ENLTNGGKTLQHDLGILLAGYFTNKNRAFLSCCREVERAIGARQQQIPRDAPRLPLATIRALGRAGPYRLIDDHGCWRQELCFGSPVAALLFIVTLRAGGSSESSGERGIDDLRAAVEND